MRRKRLKIKPISEEEMKRLAKVYADCFSNDSESAEWQSAYEEHIQNCRIFNQFMKGESK